MTAGFTGLYHHTRLVELGLPNFLPRLPSQVTGIAGMSHHAHWVFCLFVLCFAVLGLEVRALCSSASHTTSSFCSSYFADRVLLFTQPSWTVMPPAIAGVIGSCHHTQLLVNMGSHKLFAQVGLKL
jgi:hypothetical protein